MAGEKILVIDDEKIVCTSFERALGDAGYEVDSALSSEAALRKVEKKEYDVIFIDYVLPGDTDGVKVCKAIKEISPDSIAVFMTGKFDKDTTWKEVSFIEAGGKTYSLYKPFASGEILKITKQALTERDK